MPAYPTPSSCWPTPSTTASVCRLNTKAACKLLQEAAALGQKRAYVYLAYLTAKGGPNQSPDPKLAERYVRMASLDMKDEAKKLYDKLMTEGWNPEP
ncbi:MAG: hypothetical protein IKA55_03910 [Akkermansia sp.]|nr:hypothetical protein [Akkermansia sp.]